MAQTRGATGNAKPRVIATVSTDPGSRRTAKAKTGAGVTKTRALATHKRKPSVKDKVEGAVEKVAGKVQRKPGKKAAGTKKASGTDGKRGRPKKVSAVSV